VKILVVCQYYYPEPVRITDICEELVKKGHEVTVLTGIPNYPMGVIYDGYKQGEKRNETINGVHIIRNFTVGRRTGVIWRSINYFSYSVFATLKIRRLDKDFDVVFVNQLSPVMMAWPAIRYKKKYNKRLVLYCLDLWPESLEVGGIRKGTLIYKMFHKISEKIYKQADKILVTSESFDEYFVQEFGMKKEDITYLPQYAEELFDTLPETENKKENQFDFVFAGNIGTAQSVETIVEAAGYLKEYDNIFWHIVGDGSELENCKKRAIENNITSVIFHGRKPVEEMPQYYAMADAMLITLFDNPVISKTLPGKVQTYMAAGKPIIGAINGETSKVIEEAKCGLCGRAEDARQLAENVLKFIQCKNKELMSINSKKYYQVHFRKREFMNKLEMELE